MSISITPRTNYSSLFNSSSSSSSSSADFNLLDYKNIKNGSYGKLMKAYYSKADSSTKTATSSSTSEDSAKTLAAIQSDASDLQTSAQALITKSSKSLFNKKEITTTDANGAKTTTQGYDMDAIYKGVKEFVSNYNTFVDSASDATSKTLQRETTNMINQVATNESLLSDVGITIDGDNKLSINEKTFKASNISDLKTLFNGNSSLSYSVSTKAAMIGVSANNEANKSNTYTNSGTYYSNYANGSILDNYF